ncbi:MAG TPA: putative Ig domain-containing protein [Verrucomicrobiae bacterium]|nr:putative Ig domain-containing protein [Verrucomicrobiae bacterium]
MKLSRFIIVSLLCTGFLTSQALAANRAAAAQDSTPPVFRKITGPTVAPGQTASFEVSARDYRGRQASVSMSAKHPQGARFDGRIFSWTPGKEQTGSFTVAFVATDSLSQKSTKTVSIFVKSKKTAALAAPKKPASPAPGISQPRPRQTPPPASQRAPAAQDAAPEAAQNEAAAAPLPDMPATPPAFDPPLSDQTLTPGQPFSLLVAAKDSRGEPTPITTGSLPDGAVFQDKTFSWTPPESAAGSTRTLTFTTQDVYAREVSQTITLTVVASAPAAIPAPTPELPSHLGPESTIGLGWGPSDWDLQLVVENENGQSRSSPSRPGEESADLGKALLYRIWDDETAAGDHTHYAGVRVTHRGTGTLRALMYYHLEGKARTDTEANSALPDLASYCADAGVFLAFKVDVGSGQVTPINALYASVESYKNGDAPIPVPEVPCGTEAAAPEPTPTPEPSEVIPPPPPSVEPTPTPAPSEVIPPPPPSPEPTPTPSLPVSVAEPPAGESGDTAPADMPEAASSLQLTPADSGAEPGEVSSESPALEAAPSEETTPVETASPVEDAPVEFITPEAAPSQEPTPEQAASVAEAAGPLEILPIEDVTVHEEESIHFTLATNRPLPQGAEFSISSEPAGAAFEDGNFVWTPAPGDAGDYAVSFSVQGADQEAQRMVNLHVLPKAPEDNPDVVEDGNGSGN